MDIWDKIYEWQMILVGIGGILLTLSFLGPGEYTVRTGSIAVDFFYPLLILFSGVALWSAIALRRS
ncbi:hypothetical protein ACH9L7_18365 (plasmid) [Haloferax sp. S1W]|uniref:hypothetical protein n=1 Tax=Haloferax sp. S1W TaxID=3377110 RepID=UPI0037C82917